MSPLSNNRSLPVNALQTYDDTERLETLLPQLCAATQTRSLRLLNRGMAQQARRSNWRQLGEVAAQDHGHPSETTVSNRAPCAG